METSSHGGARRTGTSVACSPRRPVMASLPSSASCIEVLRSAGFRALHQERSRTTLQRGSRTVVVPAAVELDDAIFARVLADAGMSRSMFDALLDVCARIVDEIPPSSRQAPVVARPRP